LSLQRFLTISDIGQLVSVLFALLLILDSILVLFEPLELVTIAFSFHLSLCDRRERQSITDISRRKSGTMGMMARTIEQWEMSGKTGRIPIFYRAGDKF